MKTMKKVMALLAVMTMALVLFTACDGKDQSKDLEGKWTVTVNLGDQLSEEMDSELEDFSAPFEVTFVFSFAEDGTVGLCLDEEAAQASLESLKASLTDYMIEMIYDDLENDGYGREEANNAFAEIFDMSIEDYVNENIHSQFDTLDVKDLVGDTSVTGTFKAKNNVLTITSDDGVSVYNIELSENSLTLDLPENSKESSEIYEGISFPVTFTKAQ